MIGIIILLAGIISYYNGNHKLSVLIFLAESFHYFNLIPLPLLYLAGYDWAFIQMIFILIYSSRYDETFFAEDEKLKKYISCYAGFLVCSILFSVVYYHVTPFSALAGCRQYLLFPSYFFLRKVSTEDFEWIMKRLFIIAFIQSALYIVEVTTGLPVLGTEAVERDPLTGKFRYLNGNPLSQFFLYLVVLFPDYYNDKSIYRYGVFIFLGALLCTLARTNIIVNLLILFYGLYKQQRLSNLFKVGLVLCLLYIPFGDALENRFGKESETDSDITSVIQGEFIDIAHNGVVPGGKKTMSYRLAWVYERGEYMIKKSIGTAIFGLGFEYDPFNLSTRYHFKVGLPDAEGRVEPKFTPDIAYGNLIASLGFVGFFIFMLIWLRMYHYNMSFSDLSPWAFVGALFVLNMLGTSLSSSKLSSIGFLIFMLFLTAQTANVKYENEVEYDSPSY